MPYQPVPTPKPVNDLLIRPATIAIRFKEKAEYRKALETYQKVLGVKAATGEAYSDTLQSWPMSKGTSGTEGTELRLSLQESLEPRTTIYWQVLQSDETEIKDRLINYDGLKLVGDKLVEDVEAPASGHEKTLREVFQDASYNRVGIVINPPIPKWRNTVQTEAKPDNSPSPTPGTDTGANYPLLLGVGGAGLLLGLVLSRLSRRG